MYLGIQIGGHAGENDSATNEKASHGRHPNLPATLTEMAIWYPVSGRIRQLKQGTVSQAAMPGRDELVLTCYVGKKPKYLTVLIRVDR